MTAYSKKILDKGLCPICKKNGLIKTEWCYNATAIYKSQFAYGDEQWYDDPVQVELPDQSANLIEYRCDKCQMTFHINDNSFVVN